MNANAKDKSVFVGNIPYDVTEDMLKDIFGQVGTVINFRIVHDRDSGKPKGYGFCEFSDAATALSAMRNLNGHEVNGRMLRVDFADGGGTSGGGGSGGKVMREHLGESLVTLIDKALKKLGNLKIYDILYQLQDYGRNHEEDLKALLEKYPILSHTFLLAFKELNIEIEEAPEEESTSLLQAPAPSFGNSILGDVPAPLLSNLPQMPMNPDNYSASLLPGQPLFPSPSVMAGGGILGSAPMPLPISDLTRDPRRTPLQTSDIPSKPRDPRLKRGMEQNSVQIASKQPRTTGTWNDPIAEMAKSLTTEQFNRLNPAEQEMLRKYMQDRSS